MYWFKPSPLPRRVAAVLLVVGALLWDLRGPTTVAYPFTAADVDRGDPVAGSIEWRPIPTGLLPEPMVEGVARTDLEPGTPLLPSMVMTGVTTPPGWWAVPVAEAGLAASGDVVILIATDPPLRTTGLVTSRQQGDRYGSSFRPALVAVPEDEAPLVAAAAARGTLVVAIRSDDGNTSQGG